MYGVPGIMSMLMHLRAAAHPTCGQQQRRQSRWVGCAPSILKEGSFLQAVVAVAIAEMVTADNV
jgi:hypothetical protein